MNTTTTELATIEIDSTHAALSAQAMQDAITELATFEMALVGGGAAILLD